MSGTPNNGSGGAQPPGGNEGRAPGLGDVVRYLVRPRFSSRRDPVDMDGLRHVLQLYVVAVVGVIVLTGLLYPLMLSGLGGDMPENRADRLFDMNPGAMVLLAIAIGPLWEEVLFRSWLGGARAAVIGLPLLALGLSVWAVTGTQSGFSTLSLFAAGAVLGCAVGVLAGRVRALSPARLGYVRDVMFPWIFYGSAGLFMLLHTSNYVDGLSSPWLLVGVLPIGFVALILGYVRMRYGLAPAIFFHAAYNALFVSIGLVAHGLAETAPDAALRVPATAYALLF